MANEVFAGTDAEPKEVRG